MTNVTMKAVDQLHISSVSQHSLQPGEEFEVSKPMSEDLEKRGLAIVVGDAAPADPAEQKAAAPVSNKMQKPLANKSA